MISRRSSPRVAAPGAWVRTSYVGNIIARLEIATKIRDRRSNAIEERPNRALQRTALARRGRTRDRYAEWA